MHEPFPRDGRFFRTREVRISALGTVDDAALEDHAVDYALSRQEPPPRGPYGAAYVAQEEVDNYHRLNYRTHADPEKRTAAARRAYRECLDRLQAELVRTYEGRRDRDKSYTGALAHVLKKVGDDFFDGARPERSMFKLVNELVSRFKRHALAQRLASHRGELATYSGNGYPCLTPQLRRTIEERGAALWTGDDLLELKDEWARERLREIVDLAYWQRPGELEQRLQKLASGRTRGAREAWRWASYPGLGRDGYPGLIVIWPRLRFYELGTRDTPLCCFHS